MYREALDSIQYDLQNGLKFVSAESRYVNIPSSSTILQPNNPWTISIWCRFDAKLNTLFSTLKSLASRGVYCYATLANFLWVRVRTGSILFEKRVPYTFNYTDMYNITISNIGGGANFLNVYVNGVLLETTPLVNSATFTVLESNLKLGYLGEFYDSNKVTYLDGGMYQTQVYNRVLTTSEVKSLYYSSGYAIPETCYNNCVLSYNFNEKQGLAVIDQCSGGLNGVLTNFTNTTIGAGNSWIDKYGNSIIQP